MINVKINELDRLKRRLSKVSQSNYRYNLKKELKSLEQNIKDKRMENQKMKNKKRVIGN